MARKQGESPIVLILGAGASVPLGMPTTVGLRKTLCDDTHDWRAPLTLAVLSRYAFDCHPPFG
jgi:hypothetical protein